LSAPLLLAIESATADASVALLRGDAVVAARPVPAERPASEALLPTLLELLAETGVALAALDAFAVSVGPGSFTGLRVGVSTVKGLAFGGAQPIVPVPTLAALASLAERPDACVAALLDAQRGEVYAALHAGDALAPPLLGPTVLRPDELAAALAERAGERPIVAIGAGTAVAAAALRDRFGARCAIASPPAGVPDAKAVGRLAQRLLAAGAGVAPEALAPVYVRRAEAEVRRTGSRFEAPPGSRGVL
jgi:tRNA threonylcarbamoyladenosine biosynthesis protein TsaB